MQVQVLVFMLVYAPILMIGRGGIAQRRYLCVLLSLAFKLEEADAVDVEMKAWDEMPVGLDWPGVVSLFRAKKSRTWYCGRAEAKRVAAFTVG